jgi:hypothetical protein
MTFEEFWGDTPDTTADNEQRAIAKIIWDASCNNTINQINNALQVHDVILEADTDQYRCRWSRIKLISAKLYQTSKDKIIAFGPGDIK